MWYCLLSFSLIFGDPKNIQLLIKRIYYKMSIPAQFDAKTIENKWYAYWMKNNYFHSEPDHRTSYTIVIPPNIEFYIWDIC